MKETFYLQLNHDTKGWQKKLCKVKNVRDGRGRAAKRHCPKNHYMWIGKYIDGILKETWDI